MKRIYKYTIAPQTGITPGPVRLLMHAGARILSVQIQGEYLNAWAVIDDAVEERAELLFHIASTGLECSFLDDGGAWRHVGTVQAHPFVWHVFHRLPESQPLELGPKKIVAGGGS